MLRIFGALAALAMIAANVAVVAPQFGLDISAPFSPAASAIGGGLLIAAAVAVAAVTIGWMLSRFLSTITSGARLLKDTIGWHLGALVWLGRMHVAARRSAISPAGRI